MAIRPVFSTSYTDKDEEGDVSDISFNSYCTGRCRDDLEGL
eukprot:CAMPEP_0182433810 /NCGR_PEP_ID=MMETSP1167-20130531/65727_1 /TAXON_ID=2988 /ORGANISM="Mallomonas Sp, Strain CCMP3275" /LENGTH=40 /DNA_ID= /DNA_START= /DNA_END= /DNA_ORIENTATION=